MSQDHQYGLFVEDDEGLVFREYCTDLESAKRRGQRLADMEGMPSMIYTIKDYRELARFSPTRPDAPGSKTAYEH
jgi:hypothetical protein